MSPEGTTRGRTARVRRTLALAAGILAAALIAAGCGSSGSGSSGTGSTSAGGGSSSKQANIAMFIVDTSNTHQQAALTGAQAAARELGNATVRPFGAAFDPNKQVNQIEDAIATGQYNVFIVDAVDGTVVVPAIRQALAKGIKVVCGFSVCGADQTRFANEVPGIVSQVSTDYYKVGGYGGVAAARACANKNPCKVVYLDGTPTLAADVSFTKGWRAEIAKHPNMQIVAVGQGQFLADPAFKAMKDILQAHPDVDVVGSVSDQEIVGAAQAVTEAGKAGKIALIGDGASSEAVKGIKAGVWYGSTVLRPYNQGYLAAKYGIGALRGQSAPALVNSDESTLIPEGYISRATVSKWKAEWPG